MMTRWRACWQGQLPFSPDLYETAPVWLAAAVEKQLPADLAPDTCGLYLATADAGAQASVAMWTEALSAGPGFANPRPFPWTLASSPSGHVAQAVGIRGPVYTLVGGAEALIAAFGHALEDLSDGRVTHAIVAALDLPVPPTSEDTIAAVVLLAIGEGAAYAVTCQEGDPAPGETERPGALLAAVVSALEQGHAAALGHPGEGYLCLNAH